MSRHRFQPRFRGLAFLAAGAGVGLIGLGLSGALGDGGVMSAPLVGGVGIALALAYLLSPTWRLHVIADTSGLRVVAEGKEPRLELSWGDIREVVASPSTHTCYVDAGTPERSLLIPGFGAPASYRITDSESLYRRILEEVDPGRVLEVDTLDRHQKENP